MGKIEWMQLSSEIVTLVETIQQKNLLFCIWHSFYFESNSRFKWDPLGVIESFMNPEFSLHEDLHDFCCMLEYVGLIRFTLADTERAVKTQRKVEPRFAGYNEHKETAGKRDRAKQEIFWKKMPFRFESFLWRTSTKTGSNHISHLSKRLAVASKTPWENLQETF